MTRLRICQTVSGGVIALVLLLVPYLFSEVKVNLITEVLIYALFAISFNLLFGYGGMLPFGYAAVFGVGAYCTALIFKHFSDIHLLAALLIAAFAGLVAGGLIGFFVVRLKGAYSALLSFAFQMFLFAVALKWRSLTNGDDGIGVAPPPLHLPVLGAVSMAKIPNVYYFTLIIVGIATLACYLFLKTPFGNSLIAIREKDTRASFLGYNVFLTKLTAFCASGVLAALAGGSVCHFPEFCLDFVSRHESCAVGLFDGGHRRRRSLSRACVRRRILRGISGLRFKIDITLVDPDGHPLYRGRPLL